MTKLADYDQHHYDYSQYWKNRKYEHLSEIETLKNLLPSNKKVRFIDIGGSYGRLTPVYANNSDKCYIIDYSLETLQKNQKVIIEKHPNVTIIAANAYKLPFRNETFDSGMMVRVLHHLEDQVAYFKELYRILTPNALFIQEYANKIHLKARVRAILHRDTSMFDVKPYQQPSKGSFEGTKGEEAPFINYHPKFIKRVTTNAGFKVGQSVGCSFLRGTPLSRVNKLGVSISIEKALQLTMSKLDLTPSIFTQLIKDSQDKPLHYDEDEIFACPHCKHELSLESKVANCMGCNKRYFKREGVWDLRVE